MGIEWLGKRQLDNQLVDGWQLEVLVWLIAGGTKVVLVRIVENSMLSVFKEGVPRTGGRRAVPKLCRIDLDDRERTREELLSFVARLKPQLPVDRVYLLGSFARGNIHEGNNIDLLLVGDFKERFFDRIARVLSLTDLPIEPLSGLHPKEVQRNDRKQKSIHSPRSSGGKSPVTSYAGVKGE